MMEGVDEKQQRKRESFGLSALIFRAHLNFGRRWSRNNGTSIVLDRYGRLADGTAPGGNEKRAKEVFR